MIENAKGSNAKRTAVSPLVAQLAVPEGAAMRNYDISIFFYIFIPISHGTKDEYATLHLLKMRNQEGDERLLKKFKIVDLCKWTMFVVG